MTPSLSPKKLHQLAMEALDEAKRAKAMGHNGLREKFLEVALDHESQAAEMLFERLDAEPTRGVLFRSAGWIALELGLDRLAEVLACKGLAGNPPKWLLTELRDLQEQASWSHHTR